MISILLEGDFHCGNLLGLGHPDHWPKDKQKAAVALWDARSAVLKQIGKVDIHILGGDLVDGPGKKETVGLLTTDVNEQCDWAEEAIREVKADHRYFVYGTPYHVVTGGGRAEDAIAKSFGVKPRETWRIGPLHGVHLMDRHVVGRSDIPYGQGTQLWKEWVRDQLHAAVDEHTPAHIHIRHHVHYFFEVRNAYGRVISCPTWELPLIDGYGGSPYPWTLRTMYYDVGCILIEIDRTGEVFIRPQLMKIREVARKDYECPTIVENTSSPQLQ
jgi:hypothetical protein